MQPDFDSPKCNDKIAPVCALIQLAKDQKWNIINLLFDVNALDRCLVDDDEWEEKETSAFPKINKSLGNYKNLREVIKSDCDGGQELYEALGDNGWTKDDLIICGCYADQCVLETMTTLRRLLPSIKMTVVKKAVKPCYKMPYQEYKQLKATVHMGTYTSLTL
jgi:hypothetical protein